MICEKCEAVGKKTISCFTDRERIYILTSGTATLRSILAGRNDPNDKLVANSVITKIMLSFERSSREDLRRHLLAATEINIQIDHCPHSSGLVLV